MLTRKNFDPTWSNPHRGPPPISDPGGSSVYSWALFTKKGNQSICNLS